MLRAFGGYVPDHQVGDHQRPLDPRLDFLAHLDVLEVPGLRTAAGLGVVGGVDLGQLVVGVGVEADRLALGRPFP
jgi:hypothetical protein